MRQPLESERKEKYQKEEEEGYGRRWKRNNKFKTFFIPPKAFSWIRWKFDG